MLATEPPLARICSFPQYGQMSRALKNLSVHAAARLRRRFSLPAANTPEPQQRWCEGKAAHPNGGRRGERAVLAYRARACGSLKTASWKSR